MLLLGCARALYLSPIFTSTSIHINMGAMFMPSLEPLRMWKTMTPLTSGCEADYQLNET